MRILKLIYNTFKSQHAYKSQILFKQTLNTTHTHYIMLEIIINTNKHNIIHKHFPDPILVKGDNEQVMNAYRYTRDLIKDYIQEIQINFNKYIEDGKK